MSWDGFSGCLGAGGMLAVPPGSGAGREVGDGQKREDEDDAAGLAYLSGHDAVDRALSSPGSARTR